MALAGLVTGVVGTTPALASLGNLVFGWPQVAELYQAGLIGVEEMAGMVQAAFPALIFGFVLLLANTVLFVVAMWRSGKVLKGATVLFFLNTVLLDLPVAGYLVEALGGVLLFTSATWIAYDARQPS